ncbi:unnamed protein product [Plutella xylostella]|uniref:(diamondback moth) hypothetical protein n=1 Tax=Plutella xylostella TaxID=51655 RepID=A0A8S4GAJ1_PLUXY|nr:unnamed protein product [Plutella xylostella]
MVNVLLVQARTEKEIREEFIQLGMECAKQHQVTPEEIQLMHQHVIPDGSGASLSKQHQVTPEEVQLTHLHVIPDGRGTRCLVACVFKKKDLLVHHAALVRVGDSVSKKHQVTPEEVQLMHQHVIPDGRGARCLVACVFKKKDLINDKGMLDIDAAHSMADKEHLDDPTMIENSKKLFELCKSVNDETVSDGEKGCDRAALLSKCLIANYSKFGFKI